MATEYNYSRILAKIKEYKQNLHNSDEYRNATIIRKKVKDVTTKEYLLQIKEQVKNILNQEEYIQRLRDSLGVAGIRYDKERVQISHEPDKFARIFGQIFEEEEKLQQMKDDLALKRVEIINQIHQLEDSKHQKVLYIVYVDGKNLKKAAQAMCFSYDYMKEIHIAALAAFEQKFLPQSA